jgi:glutathione S-transferase
MSTLTLVIGNRNYSSWSLRAWLALKHAGATFDEIMIPLSRPDTGDAIRAHSPAGKVPVLRHGALTVWDSLAICEYLAETFPAAGLWPDGAEARAVARAASAEMHSGFQALRSHMPMNVRKLLPGKGRAPGVDIDLARIGVLWESCRERFGGGGDFLFGAFSAADAMFAPVVSRCRTYDVALSDVCQAYTDAVSNLPAMREWAAAAAAEPHAIEEEEL